MARTVHTYISNPLDTQKTKLLMTKPFYTKPLKEFKVQYFLIPEAGSNYFPSTIASFFSLFTDYNDVIFFSEEPKYAKIPSWMSDQDVTTRIVGGKKAKSPIPWQVHVHINTTDINLCTNHVSCIIACGGTIIDEETILSAAHCYYPLTKNNVQFIEAGIKKDNSDNGQNVPVKEVIIHPSYNDSRTNGKFDGDIAILKLETPLIFNDHVSPAQLPDPSLNLDRFAGNSDRQELTLLPSKATLINNFIRHT